jgi:putative toxin-antitoxin system antitoxin component (TIGR02293 family)
MTASEAPIASPEEQRFALISEFLGGSKTFPKGHRPTTNLEAHEALVRGLPGASVGYLVDHLEHLEWAALEKPIAMSLRTFQRVKHEKKPLDADRSSRVWKFAEVLAKAVWVFGTQHKAEQWLAEPAQGLNGHRPSDLLATQTGTELVEQFLERLDRGVYV